MTKLTRYKSFEDLKSSTNSISIRDTDYSKEMQEFEDLMSLLRRYSILEKKKVKRSIIRHGR